MDAFGEIVVVRTINNRMYRFSMPLAGALEEEALQATQEFAEYTRQMFANQRMIIEKQKSAKAGAAETA
jgi:hypothetical protein